MKELRTALQAQRIARTKKRTARALHVLNCKSCQARQAGQNPLHELFKALGAVEISEEEAERLTGGHHESPAPKH